VLHCGDVQENARVGIYHYDGAVLRTQKPGEADHMVTLLARRSGRVRAVAKGVRRDRRRAPPGRRPCSRRPP
jgi:DNA repair protein RecO (recombination protein O)